MKIESLSVAHFRNLQEFSFEPGPGVNVIFGDNAQGKTNLLEAVWLFTGARSFRGAKERDFIQKEKELCSLDLRFWAREREQTAAIRYGVEKRVVELNEIRQERPTLLAGVFCAVVFSPDHMSLIKNGPEGRRRMLDISLAQAYPKYARVLENYSRALRQRNTLLKDIAKQASLLEMLEVWDRHIADYGGYLTMLRAGYVNRLSAYVGPVYDGISGGREKTSIRYLPGFEGYDAGFDLKACREALAQELLRTRAEDLRLGVTGAGPHRDDLDILIDGMSARSFGSQGQQRSAILAIKLAECEILQERGGEAPVVMLDDVMSELDEGRRNYLLNHLDGKQVFITCCDPSVLGAMAGGSAFQMRSGALVTGCF